jgi:hypothetical protein
MKYIILFLALFFYQFVFSDEIDSDAFYRIYKVLESESSFENVEKLYSVSYLSELRSDLKSKCGVRCIFGLNRKWESIYRDFLLAKDSKYIEEYSAVKIDDKVKLTVLKTSCHSYGDIYEITFINELGVWKVDSENISITLETSPSKIVELKKTSGCIHLRELGL